MNEAYSQIELDPQDAAYARILGGMGEVLSGVQERYVRCAEEKKQAQKQLEAQSLPVTNIVAEGMQNEFVALFNAMYARGMVSCSKKEFMERMANALGCPPLADYSRQLNKIKQAYKYESIFDELKNAAIQERDKND